MTVELKVKLNIGEVKSKDLECLLLHGIVVLDAVSHFPALDMDDVKRVRHSRYHPLGLCNLDDPSFSINKSVSDEHKIEIVYVEQNEIKKETKC
jgi:hypothetical protein